MTVKYTKLSAALLAAAILLQLAVPALFVAQKNRILQYGAEYRLRVESIHVDDNVLELSYRIGNLMNGKEARYAALSGEQMGTVPYLLLSKEKPEGPCFKSASVREYRCPVGEYAFPDIDEDKTYQVYADLCAQGHTLYSTIKIYREKALLTGVYLDDGTPVEELFR